MKGEMLKNNWPQAVKQTIALILMLNYFKNISRAFNSTKFVEYLYILGLHVIHRLGE